MSIQAALKSSYLESQSVLAEFLNDETHFSNTAKVSEVLAQAFQQHKKALICGNGGSNCDAMHFAEEFTGRYRKNRRALPVISLSDSSHITCVANDFGYQDIFSRGVEAYGQEGDLFFGISTSGNSENVINAVNQAKQQGLYTVALLGKDGGKLKGICDIEFIVKAQTADRIQEVHMMILHIIIEGVERRLFPELY